MQERSSTPQSTNDAHALFRGMRIMFFAITGGLMLCAVMLTIAQLRSAPAIANPKLIQGLLVGVIVVAFAAALIANKQISTDISKVKNSTDTDSNKLKQYLGSLIRYLIICEMPALFSVIIFYLTSNKIFLAIAAALLVVMTRKLPTRARIIEDTGVEI